MSQSGTRRGIRAVLRPQSPRARWSRSRRGPDRLKRVTEQEPNGTIRIRPGELFAELRAVHADVRSVKQTLNETVKPKLETHDKALETHDKQLDNLNVKFYGVLAGGVLGMLAILADAFGVFAR